MCGEKGLPTLRYSPQSGSPPHMRGKGCTTHVLLPLSRITPAHAGKSLVYGIRYGLVQDHPPHMRGKGLLQSLRCLSAGITPAHAGKRWALPLSVTPCRDHPRTCGEKGGFAVVVLHKPGSPPHMRGKVTPCSWCYAHRGITPAHAGKRSTNPGVNWMRADHPRTCGEKLILYTDRC